MITIDRRRPYIIPFLVVLIGIVASFSIYSLMTALSFSDRKETFLQQANNHYFAIEERMLSTEDILTSLTAFVKNTGNLKRRQFDNFANTLLQRHQEIQALEWIPRVRNKERSRYILRAQAEGYQGFQIKERIVNDGKSLLAPAIDRPEFFPVFYVYPFKGNEAAVGFDLGSNPERLAALVAARDTGRSVMTQRITLVQEKGSQAGVLMFLPIYQQEEYQEGSERENIPSTIKERREQLTGFALIVLRVGDLIVKSRSSLEENVDILVADIDSSETLYDSREDPKAGFEFSHEQTRKFGQRKWLFTLFSKPGAYVNNRPTVELLVLFGALFLACLSGGAVFLLARSHQKGLVEVEKGTQDLQKSEQRFALAVEGSSVGIWDWIDVNGEQEYWSPQFYKLLGFENEEIRASQKNFMTIIHPDDVARTTAMMGAHLNGAGAFDIEYRLKTKSGEYKWFRASGQVGRDQNGNPMRMVGSIQDIHDQKIAKIAIQAYAQDLKRSNAELEQFAYVASHDLKAPLRGIHNLALWIEDNIQDHMDEETEGYLKLLKGRIRRLENLLASLLEYSRVGQNCEETISIDLNALLYDVTDILSAKDNGFVVNYDLPTINAPSTVLNQTFQNLISNAIKHHDQNKGSIQIEHSIQDKRHVFTIIDDGPGIPNDMREKVFKMFQTLRPRDEVEGSGMGLAIVKKLINSHGGNIWIESTAHNVGTIVKFSLPAN